MEHMGDCFELIEDAWNRWGGARVEYIIGTGPMRDKRTGEILPESLLGDYEAHHFTVGVRDIWCVWDGEKLTLSRYPTGYKLPTEYEAPPVPVGDKND